MTMKLEELVDIEVVEEQEGAPATHDTPDTLLPGMIVEQDASLGSNSGLADSREAPAADVADGDLSSPPEVTPQELREHIRAWTEARELGRPDHPAGASLWR